MFTKYCKLYNCNLRFFRRCFSSDVFEVWETLSAAQLGTASVSSRFVSWRWRLCKPWVSRLFQNKKRRKFIFLQLQVFVLIRFVNFFPSTTDTFHRSHQAGLLVYINLYLEYWKDQGLVILHWIRVLFPTNNFDCHFFCDDFPSVLCLCSAQGKEIARTGIKSEFIRFIPFQFFLLLCFQLCAKSKNIYFPLTINWNYIFVAIDWIEYKLLFYQVLKNIDHLP